MRCPGLFLAAFLFSLLAFQPGPTWADIDGSGWRTLSEGWLTVRYHDPSRALAGEVLERAGVFLEGTSRFLGVPWEREYVIIVARNREEFKELQPTSRPAPEWAGALTYPALGLVLIMTPGAMETGGSRYWALLQHEMAHLLLGDAETRSGARLPRWFQEGVATYVSGEMSLPRLLHLGWAQVTGGAPDFRDLEFSFPDETGRAEAAYASSYLFVRYLTRRFGEDAVARLLEESLNRGGIGAGVAGAFGLSLAELLEGFDQYARVKATWVPVITSTASVWGVITMLLFITWFRKKVQGIRTLRQWEEEELWEKRETEPPETTGDGDRPTLH